MEQGSKPFAFTRREALKGIGAVAGAAVASVMAPTFARAVGVAAFPQPDLMRPVNSTALYQGYLLTMQKNGFQPQRADTLYALTCETRAGIPLNTGTATVNYDANSIIDQSVTAPVNAGPVGPTMVFTRGRSTGVFFQNTMTGCGQDSFIPYTDPASHYTPHGFTVANLHTHGLHVSPNAPEDDVLIMVASSNMPDPDDGDIYSGAFSFRYQVPADHPVGTFWYHPHKHGSVSTQLATGMAGALIIRSDKDDKDFDQLLAERCNITQSDERIMVFATINYTPDVNASGTVVFDPQVYAFGTASPGCPVGSSPTDQSVMLVNGQNYPTLAMRKGEIQRWRIINATVGQVIIPKLKNDQLAVSPSGIEAAPAVPTVAAIAVDGIALPPFYVAGAAPADGTPYYPIDYSLTDVSSPQYLTTGELITVAAGQRLDLVVQAQDSGVFVLWGADLDEAPNVVAPGSGGSTPGNVYTRPLLKVQVTADSRSDQSMPTYGLFKEKTIQRPVSGLVLDGARVPLKGGDSVAYRSMAFSDPLPNTQPFLINGVYFEEGNPPGAQVQLQLNATDWWYNYSKAGAHIFHIHINSFQLVARCPTLQGLPNVAQAVAYQMPIWRDTLYFDSRPPKNQQADGRGVIMVSKQVDYTGEFVMHCHNVFHEDSGMMLTVSIEDPAAPPTAAPVSVKHKH